MKRTVSARRKLLSITVMVAERDGEEFLYGMVLKAKTSSKKVG